MRALPRSLTRALAQDGRDLTVLVVRLAAMGDILRTLPPVRLLRRALPRAEIFWVVDERWSVVLENHPDLSGVLTVPRAEWSRLAGSAGRWPTLLRSIGRLARRLRELRAGLAIDFHGNLRSGILCRLSGSPVRLGYAGHQQKEGNRLFTTHRVPSGDRRTPRMERNLDLVRGLGLADGPLPPVELPMARAGAARAEEIRKRLPRLGESYAVISPGASPGQAYKKPPSELLAAACDRLRHRGVASLIVYGPGEERDAERVRRLAPGSAVMAPPTDLPTLAALLGRARLFVGGDSGPLHLSCATGCPVLGLYGPTDPQVNRPWAVPFRAVFPPGRSYSGIKRRDRESGSFEGLRTEHVEAAIDSLVNSSSRGGG